MVGFKKRLKAGDSDGNTDSSAIKSTDDHNQST
jgi:hypothetical protein